MVSQSESQKADEYSTNAYLEHERLVSLVNSMVDGVIAVDSRVRIALYNGAALNILDVNGSLENKYLSEVCGLIDSNNQPVDVVELIKSTKTATVSRDLRLVYADGSAINLYLSIAPVHHGYGKNLDKRGYVILLRDISREKSLEEERDEFISVVSHELRTPVAIAEGNISNALYLLQNGKTDTIESALEQAHNQVLFLAGMLNDLSTLSRAERNALEVTIEPINVHELVKDLADSYSKDAEAKGLRIKTDLKPGLELLQSSRLYVREILQNFVTNAIKYTEKGHITIGARPSQKGVSIWVEDTGIGISRSDLERIYDKFFRSEDYRTRQNNGTGIGLYVTMKLARLIHADLESHSVINKGSRFTIYFPDLQ